ncbi:MAG TPA: hypothetical protein VJQ57_03140 [Acidimicrobiia bacterium]|nr:hypothetical protein [Acidimicrobiia bacterium]
MSNNAIALALLAGSLVAAPALLTRDVTFDPCGQGPLDKKIITRAWPRFACGQAGNQRAWKEVK